ncbi:hypothetical protein B0H19DRAFT_535118 [Mycena capillaripes]|nr:hypothetical protein B0H19DRAFT_535118 [Mycena capillaripes]
MRLSSMGMWIILDRTKAKVTRGTPLSFLCSVISRLACAVYPGAIRICRCFIRMHSARLLKCDTTVRGGLLRASCKTTQWWGRQLRRFRAQAENASCSSFKITAATCALGVPLTGSGKERAASCKRQLQLHSLPPLGLTPGISAFISKTPTPKMCSNFAALSMGTIGLWGLSKYRRPNYWVASLQFLAQDLRSGSMFKIPITPSWNLAALPRNLSNDFCINLFWATPEQILQQRIWQPGTGWLQASPVADGLIPVAPQKSGSIVEGDHDLNQLSISNAYNSPPNPRQIAIAAGGWSDDITVNIRVYTQSGGSIREVCLDKGQDSAGSLPDFYHGWYNGSFQGTCAPWSALCCITLDASNMELFYQTEDNVIHTSYYDGKNWSSATLSLTDAMPGTDMAVVYNHDRSNAMFFLQDKDSFLCSLRYTNSTWEPVVRVFSAATATPIAATYLSESDAIFLYFKDNTGQVQEYRGRFDGEWVLQDLNGQPSQTLGSVAAVSWHNNFEGWGGLDEFRLYMQGQDGSLIESNGNNPGTLGTVAALPNVNISAFVLGWIGRFLVLLYWVDPDKILQQRVWKDKWLSTNPIGAPLLTLDPLVVEAKWISECITEIGGNNNALSAAVRAMSNELTTSSPLHDAAEAAVAGISELALSIEALSKPYGSSRDALMAKCKGQSLTVAQRFNDLHTEAHAILGQATNLATQITYQQTIIQSNLTRVAEMQTLTAKKQTAIQQEMKTQTDAIQTENDAIATARQALLNAEQKKEQDEEDDADTSCLTTVLTAIVPFLGFAATAAASQGFDEAIKAANAAIEAAATNMASDQKALENSQKNYAAIAEQVASLTQLQETLSGFGPVLQSQSDTVTTMQTRTGTLENNALNVGVFVGKLAGKASALQFQDTATLLAQTVLAIQKLLETKNQLTGILVDDPESLDPVLQAIAKSPLEHTAVDEMILGP